MTLPPIFRAENLKYHKEMQKKSMKKSTIEAIIRKKSKKVKKKSKKNRRISNTDANFEIAGSNSRREARA